MERRQFLQTSLGASCLTALGSGVDAAENSDEGRQYYELRRYRLESEEDRALVDEYLREAAIPAYNRLGIKPVGVFQPAEVKDGKKADGRTLTVLLPYKTLQQFAAAREELAHDKEYRKAAEAYLGTPQSDPAYQRIESTLMVAFSGFPRLKVPEQTKAGRSRLFELRTYESHNEHKARLKVEMFDKAEIELFTSLGFSAVFYGDKLVGDKLPNLTYMLVFDDPQQRDQLWKKFVESDGWQKLKAKKRYRNTVSKVHNWFLRPTDYSQL